MRAGEVGKLLVLIRVDSDPWERKEGFLVLMMDTDGKEVGRRGSIEPRSQK
jgi:hypothetical protein